MKQKIDEIDKRLLAALTEDGQRSAGQLAEELGVTGPTVRTRLKALLAGGICRVSALVDPFHVKGLTVALVGMTIHSHEQLGQKLDQVSTLPDVSWAAVVTGRYDIIAEVVLGEEVGELFRFMDEDLAGVGGIASSESFVVMKARRKWLCLPRGMRAAFRTGKEYI
ncbi:MAG: Lrp/AsnC family transcriptional regulator [Desulfovibrionaceae bacterium]